MLVIASQNGSVGIEAAMQVLRNGGSAMDAVEAGVRLVEANPDDHSVGYGGYPNLLGEVELDAAIMDGSDLTSGAVGALKGYPYPISVARQVLEKLPHIFLVGEGAARFAAEMGFEPRDLLSEPAREAWEKRLREDVPSDVLTHLAEQPDLWRYVGIATDPEHTRGTTNFIAQDARGNLAVGVSTSGWAWKYPGRIGDSPIVGAGLYADNRFGAAACTGTGEMAIRAATAHSVVFYMKMGLSVTGGRAAGDDGPERPGRALSERDELHRRGPRREPRRLQQPDGRQIPLLHRHDGRPCRSPPPLRPAPGALAPKRIRLKNFSTVFLWIC